MLKKWLFYPLGFFLCLAQASHAAGPSGISVTHCTTNCGKVLIGAARIDMSSIQWQGADSKGLLLALYGAKSSDSLGNRFFGFTGSFDSNGTPDANLIDYTGSATNKWFFVSTGEVSIGEPATGNKAPKLGFYFSPAEAKVYDSSSSYFAACTGSSCQQGYPSESLVLRGEGVADSKTAPALTLNVTVNGATPAQQDVSIATRSITQFAITPKLNTSLVPADAQPVKYAQVIIKVDEKSTSCTNINGLVSFSEAQEEPNDFLESNYYHHLVPSLTNQGKCSRIFSYLVSVDRTFTFDATNQQTTGNGYVQYTFYINGHYNPFAPAESEYPNSHNTFRLRTGSTVINNQKPTASFSVSNQSVDINQSIALDASASFDSDGSIATYEWSSLPKATFTATATQKTSVSFTQVGTYTVSLKVTDNQGESSSYSQNITVKEANTTPTQTTLTINIIGSGSVKSADGTINCTTSSCSKSYTKNTAMTLAPAAASGYQFSGWSGACINNVQANGEVTLTLDADKTCDVTFTKTLPSSNLKAVLLEPIVTNVQDDPSKFAVTLDASQSTGNITGYQIQIYNSSQADKPIVYKELSLSSPKTTENLPINESYAIYLIVKDSNSNPPQSDVTTRTLSALPLVDFMAEPNAERVTLTAKLIGNGTGGLTYRWLCEECLWKNRNDNVINETKGQLENEALEIGTHIIKLLVLDNNGQIVGGAAKVVEIKKNSPPISSFTITPQEVALGREPEIKLDASDSVDPDGGKLQYIWTVDGTKGTLEADPTDVTNNAKRIFKPNQSVFNPSLSDATASNSTVDFGFSLTVTDDESVPQQAISNPSFKVTLPIAQFTVAQDNVVITLDSQGSNGVAFSPMQKASTIQKYEWKLNNVLHFEGATDKMVLTSGKHTVSLKLIDSYGYTREIVKPVLATTMTAAGTGFNVQGTRINTLSKFAALLPTTIVRSQPFELPVNFQLAAEDVGKQIDLLLVVGIEPFKTQYTGMDANYFAIVPEIAVCPGSFTISGGYCGVNLYATPDVWMAQLTEPYERGVIAESNMVRTLTRSFSTPGMHYIFAGYRRPDNAIIYSTQPIAQFEVK